MKLLRQRGQLAVGRIDLDVVLSIGMGGAGATAIGPSHAATALPFPAGCSDHGQVASYSKGTGGAS
jgi:hypothetical protein